MLLVCFALKSYSHTRTRTHKTKAHSEWTAWNLFCSMWIVSVALVMRSFWLYHQIVSFAGCLIQTQSIRSNQKSYRERVREMAVQNTICIRVIRLENGALQWNLIKIQIDTFTRMRFALHFARLFDFVAVAINMKTFSQDGIQPPKLLNIHHKHICTPHINTPSFHWYTCFILLIFI